MSEYRLVGSAMVDGKRERVVVHREVSGVTPGNAEMDRLFGYYCDQRGYRDPVLIEFYLA